MSKMAMSSARQADLAARSSSKGNGLSTAAMASSSCWRVEEARYSLAACRWMMTEADP